MNASVRPQSYRKMELLVLALFVLLSYSRLTCGKDYDADADVLILTTNNLDAAVKEFKHVGLLVEFCKLLAIFSTFSKLLVTFSTFCKLLAIISTFCKLLAIFSTFSKLLVTFSTFCKLLAIIQYIL